MLILVELEDHLEKPYRIPDLSGAGGCRAQGAIEKLSAGSFVWPEWLTGRNTAGDRHPGLAQVNELCFVILGEFPPLGKLPSLCSPNCTPGCLKYCSPLFSHAPSWREEGRFIYCLVESE